MVGFHFATAITAYVVRFYCTLKLQVSERQAPDADAFFMLGRHARRGNPRKLAAAPLFRGALRKEHELRPLLLHIVRGD